MSKKVNINIPNPNSVIPQIKLHGDWVRAERVIDKLGPRILKGYDIAVEKFARRILTIVRTSIRTGTPPKGGGVYWEPLAPSTLRRYKNFPDHHLYHLTGLYGRSVGLFRYKSRTLVGLPINKKRSSQGGLTLNELAKILEFGTGGRGGGKSSGTIPPRPLWAPSLKAVGGRERLRKEILTEIRRQLSSLGIKPNQVKW